MYRNHELMIAHESIDQKILHTNNRIRIITQRYKIIDAVIAIILFIGLVVYGLLLHLDHNDKQNSESVSEAIYIFQQLVIVFILALSSFRLARFVRTTTGKKSNIFLVALHILNVFVYSSFLVAYGVVYLIHQ